MLKPKNQRRLISLGMILVIAAIFAIIDPTKTFLSPQNATILLQESAYAGLVALGATFVMVGGGVDLSGGGIVCVCGVVAARVSLISGMPGIVVILAALAAGALCGLLNGLLVTKLHLTEFVTTLATGSVFTGLAYMTTFRQNGRMYTQSLSNKSFLAFGGKAAGIFYITIAWLLLIVIMQVVFTKTRFGTHVSAQGSNRKAADMSGVNGEFVKVMSYVICGAFAGLAAAFVVAYQRCTTQSLGTGMDFQAVAACVVGGVVLGGGKGDALSAFFGAVFMAMIKNGIYKLGLSTGYFYLLQGIIIVAVTNFDTLFGQYTQNRLRKVAELAVTGGARNG